MRRAAVGLGVVLALAAADAAHASTFAIAGDVAVLTPAPGEAPQDLTVSLGPGGGDLVATARNLSPGPGCSADAVDAVRCPATGVRGVRVTMGRADGPGDPLGRGVRITVGTLDVQFTGSAEADRADIVTTGHVAASLGGGDDHLRMRAGTAVVRAGAGDDVVRATPAAAAPVAPSRVDGGPGDDDLAVTLPGAHVVGGPGHDGLVTWSPGRRIGRQIVDCGPGPDAVVADLPDVVAPACGPRPTGLRDGMTVGRFTRTGAIRASLGALPGRLRVRVSLDGPRLAPFVPQAPGTEPSTAPIPYGASAIARLGPGPLTPAVLPWDSAIRAALRARRTPVPGIVAAVAINPSPRGGRDSLTLVVRGTLRPT